MDAVMQFWNERAPREKLILSVGGIVLLLVLFYLFLIEPAAQGITRLERGLPQQRQQSAQLEALLSEVRNLKSRTSAATISAAEARTAIEKSLAGAGLKAARIVPLSDGDLQISFANVSFSSWSTWLSNIEREIGARATNVTANATATPGNADIEVALRLARK